MEFFKAKPNIDFLGIRKWSWAFSAILIIASFVSIGVKGINWGLDFTGGYSVQVNYPSAPNLELLKHKLDQAGFSHSQVITFGSPDSVKITLAPTKAMIEQDKAGSHKTSAQDEVKAKVMPLLGANASVQQTEYIGPSVGAQLAQRGILAMFIAVLATMLYIALRFEMRFAASAAIALAHDPIIIIGIFSFFQIQFNLTALAAVLAVIGYSLNDTVVIYDRIRENFRKLRKASVDHVVNRAVNDTLSRTVMTSGLTLLVVIILFIWGGPSIHNFALALMLGVIIGTYSSIYVAGTLAILLGLDREALLPKPKLVDDRP